MSRVRRTTVKRARGRPRQYEEKDALAAAGELFWTKGFRATSLDDLSKAMGMNRPSIYNAFGNKEAIYRRALEQFGRGMESAFDQTMLDEDDVHAALTSFYRAALSTYTEGERPKGCMFMSTAVTAAPSHPEIQADLLAVIRSIDRKMTRRLRRAIDEGQLPASFDASGRAALAQAVLHTLALRARAGEPVRKLRAIIENGVDLVLS